MDRYILEFCTSLFKTKPFRRVIGNKYFPVTFWLMNVLELSERGIFSNRSSQWIRSFLSRHLYTRASCFVSVYRRLHPVLMGRTIKNFVYNDLSGGYCNHCGQCCFFFGGLGKFPEPWPFPNRWKRYFTDGLGRYHLFCAFLWEWHGSGKSFCSIYPWRPLVCDLFGEDECRYYLDAPHLPYAHLERVSPYVRSIIGRL